MPEDEFIRSGALWPSVSEAWKIPGKYLGFEVITYKKLPIDLIWHDLSGVPIALIVKGCDAEQQLIYQPGTRFSGEASPGMFKYDAVIEYMRSEGDHSDYNIFEDFEDLCFHIQTLTMPVIARGETYRVPLDASLRRIAEGEQQVPAHAILND